MVSIRVGPRLEDGCVSKNFHINTRSGNPGICQLSSAGTCVRYFWHLPLPYTNVSIDRDLPLVEFLLHSYWYALMDGTYTITRIDCISHIEQEYTRWLSLWDYRPHPALNGLGTVGAWPDSDPSCVLACWLRRTLVGWAYGYLSYGGCRAWSIWTMPAILRILLPK